MLVTVFGIFKDVSWTHCSNALSPMLVTEYSTPSTVIVGGIVMSP